MLPTKQETNGLGLEQDTQLGVTTGVIGTSVGGNRPNTSGGTTAASTTTSTSTIPLNQKLGIPLTNTSSTVSGSTDFVKKLFLMLEDNSYDNIVRWTENGDSFVVIDTNEFTKEILPKHFKHSNFASFVRQLNKYDFHKVKLSNEEKQLNEYGDNSWEFKHNDFRRHDREALETIKRKGPTQKRSNISNNNSNSSNNNQNNDELLLNNEIIIKDLESKISKISKDYKDLSQDFKKLNGKYTNVLDSFMTLKSINDRYINNFNLLVENLLNQGIKIPRLDLSSLTPVQQHQQLTHQQQHQPLHQHHQHQPSASSVIPPVPQQQHQLHHQHQNSHQHTHPHPHTQITPDLQQQQQQSKESPEYQLGAGFHVLLVEDDQVSIMVCTKFLEKCRCTVEVVTDGINAITALENSKYDIVLMDIVMPNLDGATATSIVRGFDSYTPIIAMTGNVENEDLYTYLRHGMNDILAKPFTQKDLYAMLEKHLRSRTPLAHQTQANNNSNNNNNNGDNGNLNTTSTNNTINVNNNTNTNKNGTGNGNGNGYNDPESKRRKL
ncbi:hypothetical protein WICMUC_003355 [Wickerhamomyces mucosus]|uniref:Transcription factor n=1 Tax=Wickerhamomyces mucosus TaxID=1378264 RepID=A0A9P8PL81_9ASCO|nr:hypothetical protein WICMUC_003355 [Wickerhamomyces mucosus]